VFYADILQTRVFLQMQTFCFLGAKTSDFLKLMVCLQGQGEERRVEPVRTFANKGDRGSVFRDFVRTSFMDGPLLT